MYKLSPGECCILTPSDMAIGVANVPYSGRIVYPNTVYFLVRRDGDAMTWNFCPIFVLFSHPFFFSASFFSGKTMHFFYFVPSSLGAISLRRKHNMRALRRFNYHKNIIRANLNLKHCVSAVVFPSQKHSQFILIVCKMCIVLCIILYIPICWGTPL